MPSGVSSDGWKEDQDAESMDDDFCSWLLGVPQGQQAFFLISWWLNAGLKDSSFQLRLCDLLGSFAWTFLPVPRVPHPFVFCYVFTVL